MSDPNQSIELLRQIRDEIRAFRELQIQQHENAMRSYDEVQTKISRSNARMWLLFLIPLSLLEAVAIVLLVSNR